MMTNMFEEHNDKAVFEWCDIQKEKYGERTTLPDYLKGRKDAYDVILNNPEHLQEKGDVFQWCKNRVKEYGERTFISSEYFRGYSDTCKTILYNFGKRGKEMDDDVRVIEYLNSEKSKPPTSEYDKLKVEFDRMFIPIKDKHRRIEEKLTEEFDLKVKTLQENCSHPSTKKMYHMHHTNSYTPLLCCGRCEKTLKKLTEE